MVYDKKCRGEEVQVYLRQHYVRSMSANDKKFLKLSMPRNGKYEKAFPHKSRRLWNDLPEDFKEKKIFTDSD